MLKRTLLALSLVAFTLVGSAAAGLASTWHGGGLFGAAPAYVVPASADLYVAFNRGSGQGVALNQLWSAYRAHPGTAAALDRLIGTVGTQATTQLNSILGAIGDQVGVALWAPSSPGPDAIPQVAIVAQLKVTDLFGGMSPFAGLATFTPVTSHQGVTIYRASVQGSSAGYACIVAGDGVLASDLTTVERVIDTGTYHAPALAYNADYNGTVATLPAVRAVTLYVTPNFVLRAQQEAARIGGGALPPQMALTSQVLKHPYAIAIAAAPDGISIVSSAIPGSGVPFGLTPNAGASVVGNNALLYESLDNLAAILMAPGILPANTFNQLQVQTGIAIERDLVPLISHEVVIDVNDEPSAIVVAVARASGSGSQVIPALPGSIELAMWVDSPAAAQQSLQRIVAALVHLAQQGQSSAIPLTLVKTTLPDGSIAYTVPGLAGVGYTIRGHWLLISTNLTGDMTAARVPLSSDTGYQAALAHVAGLGPLYNVSYFNVTRTLSVVDAWLAFAQKQSSSSQPFSISGWQQAELLIAPIHSIIAVTRQVAGGAQSAEFITVGP